MVNLTNIYRVCMCVVTVVMCRQFSAIAKSLARIASTT